MGATLYLLRQQPSRISPSLFQAGDVDIDIVLVEQGTSFATSPLNGAVLTPEGMVLSDSSQTVTYDEVVEKIFSLDHVIVI